MSDKLKKIDENDIAELFKGLKSKSSMDDSGFSLWWDKRKSRNVAELERNISDAFNARVYLSNPFSKSPFSFIHGTTGLITKSTSTTTIRP